MNATMTKKNLATYFAEYPNASLRKIAKETGVCYGMLLKKSKAPVAGEAYDPEATNWAAVETHLVNKGVDISALDWDSLNAGPSRQGATLQKDASAFKIGDLVYLRQDNEVPYEIVYKTETHVVIMKEGTSEPQAWSNNTFILHGPVFEPRAPKAKKGENEAK